MSVGPTSGPLNSIAGTPRAQARGTEAERLRHESSNQLRHTEFENRAEQASGIGEMEAEQETADRDANGRRPWELSEESVSNNDEQPPSDGPPTNDQSGTTGGQLDVSG